MAGEPVWTVVFHVNGTAVVARVRKDLVGLVEGLALRGPPPRIAEVHRMAIELAGKRELPSPSYRSVRRIIQRLDRGLPGCR